MARQQRRVTAVDVAREAGVSQTTVSYVLNDVPHQKISAETRERVHAAVAKLGYTPSAAARALRTGQSDIVLLLLADMPLGHTAIELVEQLTQVLQRKGLNVVTRIEDGGASDSLWADLAPRTVVVLAPMRADRRRRMEAAGIQVINAWRCDAEDVGHDTLAHSQHRVGELQAGHLAAAGHRQLGYAAPADRRLSDFYELRLQGVRDACGELGIAPPVVREIEADKDLAAVAAQEWRAAGVTAVCAFNDEVAFALLAGMRAAGLAAPGDLAVIGVDDIPVARFAEPPLTTVDQHMGIVAGELAQAILRRQDLPEASGEPRGESATVVARQSA
ncbi:LacI family DNA-binding transcriptional regulator [Streptomyces caeruleatus]|uniref:LacI family DNA-binding transcriptional regulator n=1 Tax=Streptomyces caeruleatus TaxID=661399 RepID=UPI00131C1FA7|nr:LacI family DNA-binding transcriptional regulator [Streptomyces caeruleatus]